MTPTPNGDDPAINPNALHEFHTARRGPRNVPEMVLTTADKTSVASKDPGHPYAHTKHISFDYFDQQESNAPFGYEHYVSLPPSYHSTESGWPLILFLHGAGESQRGTNESYASLRHGIPKVILCYDQMKANPEIDPSIDIPVHPGLRKSKQTRQGDRSEEPVLADVCSLLAENFITVTPSLNMVNGYGWNASILSALLDEVVERYRVDLDRIHVTGFSMGGYGTWDLAMRTPNRFASLMPVCGGGDDARAKLIGHLPHWVHHGEKDDIIPLKASRQMVDKLREAGADVRFSVYPVLMHDSWTAAYGNIEVYRWMLDCKRRVGGDEKAVPDENKFSVL